MRPPADSDHDAASAGSIWLGLAGLLVVQPSGSTLYPRNVLLVMLNGFIGAPAVIGVSSSTAVKTSLLRAVPGDENEHALSEMIPASTAALAIRRRGL